MDVDYHSNDFDWLELQERAEKLLALQALPEGDLVTEPELERGVGEEGHSPAAWDAFHTRHSQARFFKERRYLTKEFPDLVAAQRGGAPVTVLEVGCGTASTAIPILSPTAVALSEGCVTAALGADSPDRFHSFVCDIVHHSLTRRLEEEWPDSWTSEGAHVAAGGTSSSRGHEVDIITLMFILSALPGEAIPSALKKLYAALKPGGVLLFRDYGMYDLAMLRFRGTQRVARNCYRRDDGTLAHFFSKQALHALFQDAGFVQEESDYCCIRLRNRHRELSLERVWLHAKFRKPV
eukprot:jgi/Mesen1/8023/ME000426S07170